MKKLVILLASLLIFNSAQLVAQSTNCATATSMNLASGSDCASGTNIGAITDNILYGACNASPVDLVWYTYTANGSNNTFTITPGTLTNAEIVIYTGNCPGGAGAQLEYCTTASGSTPLTTTWGMVAGQQVWLGVASTSLNNGTFTLCVNSTPPVAGVGNTCSQAIPVCNSTFSQASMAANSSGQQPNCFGSAPQLDIWIQFTITKSGTLAWTATPNSLATEFDWCLWDISGGCPGAEACCNYNYAGGSSAGFGMQTQAGNEPCGYNLITNKPPREFSPPIAVTCGQTYAVQISNYSNDFKGFSLAFTNSTCQITSNASFVATPTLVCGASLTAAITNSSTGDCAAVWDYGDGSATYTGGTPPNHTYNTPGTFAITETIGGACASNHTEFVELLAPLAATVASTSITCSGSCIGTASITSVSGGDGIYTYSWNTGSTATNLSALCAGIYSVTISNAKCGTAITQTVNIASPPALTLTATPTNATCGANNGSIFVSASGGTPTYSYSINGGAYTGTTNNTSLGAGTYTLSVKDINGCIKSVTASITVTASPTVTVNSATICSGNSTTLTANGATTYSWTPGTGLSSTTNTIVTANPTVTTTYTVVGTAGTCSAQAISILTVNTTPTVTVNSPTICAGVSTTLTSGGATTYNWNPGTGLSSTTGPSVTANPTVTTTYTITGTTGTCTSSVTSIVTVNPLPTVTVNSATICPGASTTLTAIGANTYTWSPPSGLSSITGATVTANPTVTTIYTITGTSVAGCTTTANSTVTIGGSITPTVNSATICAGSSATLTAGGGTTYTWSPGTGLSSTSGSTVTANPGASITYTITAASGGCTGTVTSVVTVNPLPIIIVNSGTICIGQQTANLNAAGAVTYTWIPSTGLSATNTASVVASPTTTTSYTVVGLDANSCINFATTSVVVNPLPIVTVNSPTICVGSTANLTANNATTYSWTAGLSATTGASVTGSPAITTNYTVTGTDGNGCTNTAVSTINVIGNPTVSVNSGPICAGQTTLNLIASSNASTFAWAPATGLSATTGSMVIASPAATQVYTIVGSAGTCTVSTTATVTVNTPPTLTTTSSTICVGQQTGTVTVSGASTYTWTGGGITGNNATNPTDNPLTTTIYTVNGIDANTCTATATAAITVNNLPIVTVNSPTICVGAIANLTANNAITYSWSAGLSATTGASVTGSPATTTNYTVTGTDGNGCTNTAVSTINVISNPTITVNSGPICAGQTTLNLIASSNASTFTWAPATGLSATTGSMVIASPAATQVYTIVGSAGTCTVSTTATVTVNSLPVPTIGSNTPCVNQTLNLNAGGATGYSWNGPNNFTSTLPTPSITGVTIAANGIYTVTVTDANTCVNTATVSIVVNPLPVVTATGSTVCLNATINLAATGGTSYSWSGPGAYSSNLQNPTIPNATTAMAGSYVVTVTDANNCVNANVAQVGINSLPNVAVNSGTICVGQQTANLNATGANSYSWTPAAGLSATTGTSVSANPAVTSSYTVTGTDLNNCKNTATLTITVNPLPLVTVSPQITSGCAPVCVNFSNTATGNGTCNWNFGNGINSTLCAPNNCFTAQGNYSVSLTLTDNNGCIKSSSASVTVYPVPHADFYATPQPTTILDNFIHFYDLTTGAFITSWTWTLANDTGSAIQNPSYLYGDTGSYAVQLVVITNHGCKDSIIKIVRIDDDYSLYVPNSFSPNSDGTNDIFYAKGEGVRDFKMYIFDRWGNQIFFSDNLYKGWDGRYQAKGDQIVQEDVYVWKIEVNNVKGEKRQLSGHVSLLK